MDKLESSTHFVSRLYAVKKPEFLEAVNDVSMHYLAQAYDKNPERQMTVMTASYADDPRVADFAQYVSQTAWNILQSQGYAMDNLVTYFTEMWTQEHNPFSSMDYHVHNMGAQISAFYFLEAPKDGCQLVIHDPRATKTMINLPQQDEKKMTDASPAAMFTPEPGTLIFISAWMPHSFTKNMTMEPTRFVHMNISVAFDENKQTNVEVL